MDRYDYLEKIRQFCLMDDDFMTKVFDGSTDCTNQILDAVFGKGKMHAVEVRTQAFIENLAQRSLRLDILAKSSDGHLLNIEVQRADKGASYKRARYHSSMLDVKSMEKGEDFNRLNDTYVVFITENDIIGADIPIYHINRYIEETGKIFVDGAHIIYVNGAKKEEHGERTMLGDLIHDFYCTSADDMRNDILRKRVRYFKEEKEGIEAMCKIMEELRESAFKEGREKTLKKVVLAMLATDKYTLKDIADATELTLEEVEKIRMSSAN